MNERIKQLLVQAHDEAVPETWTTLSSLQQGRVYEKFAELIIGECLNQCYNRGMNDELYVGQLRAAAYIEQHFGVRESTGWVCPKCGTDRTKAVCPLGHSASVDGRCPMVASTL
jgi:hypothetical protein